LIAKTAAVKWLAERVAAVKLRAKDGGFEFLDTS